MTRDSEVDRLRQELDAQINRISELDSPISQLDGLISAIEGVAETESPGRLWQQLLQARALRNSIKAQAKRMKVEVAPKISELRGTIEREYGSGEAEILDDLIEGFEDRLDGVEDRVDSLADRLEELQERIRERLRESRHRERAFHFRMPHLSEMPEIPDVGRLIEESLSGKGPSMIVSSVRLPEADLKLIDSLVDASIFKSRNEGIAFFAHRGIESSEEWLRKAREKLDEIRKLKDETRTELEKVLKDTQPESRPAGEKAREQEEQ